MGEREVKRDYAWVQMGRLEAAGLGSVETVNPEKGLRRKFVLKQGHPAIGTLTSQSSADGFVRAELGSLLFRHPAFSFKQAVPSGLRARAMTSDKGLEFRWKELTEVEIRQLFDIILALATVPVAV